MQAMTIRIPDALYERLRKAAFDQRIPMIRIITTALTRELGDTPDE